MRQSNPSSGRSNPRTSAQATAPGNRNWARRGRSSMRPRKQCSRGIGENSARRWTRSSGLLNGPGDQLRPQAMGIYGGHVKRLQMSQEGER